MKGFEGKSCGRRASLSGARSTLDPADPRSKQRPGSLGAHNLPRHNMGKRYKVCLWGSDSIYCWEHVKEFGDEFDIFSIVTARTFEYKFDIRIVNPFKRRPLSIVFGILNIARIMYLFRKYDRKCDCHLVHYLSLPYALAIGLLPLRKPIIYCVYGSDVRTPRGWNKKIVKKALGRIDVIFSGIEKSFWRKYIVSKYGVSEKKIVAIWWCPVNSCFKRFDGRMTGNLRRKWNLTKEYVVFSPRATKEFYNQHLLIEGVGLLNDELKKKIQVVLTGLGDLEYRKRLVEMGKTKGIEVVDLGRRLTPEEMAEIYNISVITPNISKGDDLGRSTFEAVACGSILLLNKNSEPYRELFRDGKYCRFVELSAEDVARSIEYILDNREALKEEEERLRIMGLINWETNKRQMSECIKGLIER
jgi:glycosyltransferase involved in cell wall biosynthesis